MPFRLAAQKSDKCPSVPVSDPLPIGGMYDGLIYGTATTTFSAISLDGLSMELPNTQGDETVKVLLPSPIVASDVV